MTKSEDETRAIRDALYILDRPAGIDEIVRMTGLPIATVQRRLANSGPMAPRPDWVKFRHDRLAGTWTLTTGARQEAEQDSK